ncbi:MAG: CehA/McbA family metallohydrolase [bacterium]
MDRLSLNNATYHNNEDGSVTLAPITHYGSVTDGSVKFAPIVHNGRQILTVLSDDTHQNNVISAFSITFEKEQGIWKIAGINSFQLPNKLNKDFQPDKKKIRKIKVSIKDKETGDPIYSRVHIQDEKGDYWPVNGHQKNIRLGSAQDVGGDVHIGNKTYAYVKPEFIADLPEGKYSIEVFHGMEYLPERLTFSVDGTNEETFSIALRRWVNMKKEGWYSGDTHTHFLSEKSAILEGQGEDLNIINVLATKWGILTTKWEELISDVDKFTGKKSNYSNEQHIVYFNEESRHGFLGHTILYPLKQLIYPLSWGDTSRGGEGIPGGFDYPPMAHLADKAHAQGAIVTAAHFPYPPGEIAIDVVLGKIDSIDLITFGDAFNRRTSTFHGFEMPTPVELWYKFLNTGAILPATAGTDKMRNIQVVGSVRTYVHIDNRDLSYDNWVAGIKKGETFVTTGPMIWLTADNRPIGSKLHRKKGDEIFLKAKVKSATPVRELEVIQGGKMIARKENPNNLLELTLEFKTSVTDSTWLAARAYSPEKLDYQRFCLLRKAGIPTLAHTSPIYVTVDEKLTTSKDDAIFLMSLCDLAIKWAQETANFQKPEHKQEMIDLFQKAKARYMLQIK